MAHAVEDYYDMPADELPSANFAGRPVSDIDMLGGYWTPTAYYPSSSSSEDGDENDKDNKVSPQRRNLSRAFRPAAKLQRRVGEKGPSSTSTLDPTDDISQGSGVTGRRWRVSRRGEQETASGSLEARTSPLFEPRRAGGARLLGYSDSVKRKRKTRTRTQTQTQSCDKIGSGTATSRAIPGRMRATSGPPGGGEAISPCAKQSRTSLAHSTRVRLIGQGTQLAVLNTGVAADESRRFAASPSSVLSTPRELYAVVDGRVEGETTAARAWRPAGNITRSPLSSSSRSNAHCRNQQAGRVDVADRRNIDWPGAVMPARQSVRVRRDSVATGLDAKLVCERERYNAERVGPPEEDDIVTFFEEFGVAVEATEATLDQFWLRDRCTAEEDNDDRSDAGLSSTLSVSSLPTASISNVGEAKAKAETPQAGLQLARQSRFSLSSASSCSASETRPKKRSKRSRLRDLLLLSPGLPGAAFLKIPAS